MNLNSRKLSIQEKVGYSLGDLATNQKDKQNLGGSIGSLDSCDGRL